MAKYSPPPSIRRAVRFGNEHILGDELKTPLSSGKPMADFRVTQQTSKTRKVVRRLTKARTTQ